MGRSDLLDDEVYQILELYHLCRDFHALPSEGGVLDQDQWLVRQLSIVAAAYHEKATQKKGKSNGLGGT
jgi:hypothetical protein